MKTMKALEENDTESANEAFEIEKQINYLQKELREKHINRVKAGLCDISAGVIFVDAVDNIEKIGDHLSNIVVGVTRHLQWGGKTE